MLWCIILDFSLFLSRSHTQFFRKKKLFFYLYVSLCTFLYIAFSFLCLFNKSTLWNFLCQYLLIYITVFNGLMMVHRMAATLTLIYFILGLFTTFPYAGYVAMAIVDHTSNKNGYICIHAYAYMHTYLATCAKASL